LGLPWQSFLLSFKNRQSLMSPNLEKLPPIE
jgi:hypothetical protein